MLIRDPITGKILPALNLSQFNQIKDLYRQGQSCLQISRQFNVSGQTVVRCLITNGIELRKDKISTLDATLITTLYTSGLTQTEIALQLGTSQKVIHTFMKRFALPTRIPKKRNQFGEANHMWKGDKAGYASLHRRVENLKGRPDYCVTCKTTDETKRYEWACINGHYEDIEDYQRMCKSCHMKYDKSRPNRVTVKDFVCSQST